MDNAPKGDSEMLIDAEERTLYWGYRHMNVASRDINDEEEVDLAGLERILYDVLDAVKITAVKPYDTEFADEPDSETENDYNAVDYEAVDIEFNPFEYEAEESDFEFRQRYETGDTSAVIAEEVVPGESDLDDYEDILEEQEPGLPEELDEPAAANPGQSCMQGYEKEAA